MIGITLPQPPASALVYGIERGAAWPTEWPMQPDAVGQYIAVHASLAWSPDHAARATEFGLTDCPRGQVVGLARVAGWARMAAEGPQWLGAPSGPSWASLDGILDPRALIDAWPLGVESVALFVDDAVPLTVAALGQTDDTEMICLGDARAPWVVPARMVRRLRRRWGSQALGSPRVMPSSTKPARRCAKPPTDDARANAGHLADMLPEGWSIRIDGFTVSIVDPTGRCRRALTRPQSRPQLADVLVRLVMAAGGAQLDAHVHRIRTVCPRPQEAA